MRRFASVLVILFAMSSASVLPSWATSTPKAKYKWVQLGVGDCGGGDKGCSAGVKPSPARCTKANSGQSAVCWDDVTHANKGCGKRKVWCTYKKTLASKCTGGGNPGFLYECQKQ